MGIFEFDRKDYNQKPTYQYGNSCDMYCIEWTPEVGEKVVLHYCFSHEPTENAIRKFLLEVHGIEYKPDYDKLDFYKVCNCPN